MRATKIATEPKTFVMILETGDEILSSLKSFARIATCQAVASRQSAR